MYNISFFQILVVIFLIFLIFGDTKKFFSNVKDFKESIFNKKNKMFRKNGTRTHSSGFGDQRFAIKLSSLLLLIGFNVNTDTFRFVYQQ